MTDVSLRPATADDVEFFFTLHERALGPYVDQVWDWHDDDQRAYLARNLALIELTPDHQGRGIGGRLIRDILDRADHKRVALSVLAVNHRAYQLYRRLGFTEVSRAGVAPEVRIRMVAEP